MTISFNRLILYIKLSFFPIVKVCFNSLINFVLFLRKKINKYAFSEVYVARGFFDQRYAKNGRKEGPGNYQDSLEFKKDAEREGIKFIILDDYKMIAYAIQQSENKKFN